MKKMKKRFMIYYFIYLYLNMKNTDKNNINNINIIYF